MVSVLYKLEHTSAFITVHFFYRLITIGTSPPALFIIFSYFLPWISIYSIADVDLYSTGAIYALVDDYTLTSSYPKFLLSSNI